MPRSYDIAEITTQDGVLTEQLRRKLNRNFQRCVEIATSEQPAAAAAGDQAWIRSYVQNYVDAAIEAAVPEIRSELLDDAYPVGSVLVTWTADDPRLAHGTWQQVGGGRYVRAAGSGVDVGDTGGENEIQLTALDIPVTDETIGYQAGDQQAEVLRWDDEATGDPVAIEPEYIALLFYRRTA